MTVQAVAVPGHDFTLGHGETVDVVDGARHRHERVRWTCSCGAAGHWHYPAPPEAFTGPVAADDAAARREADLRAQHAGHAERARRRATRP